MAATEPTGAAFVPMARYYFDLRDNGVLSPDEDGAELDGLDRAKAEALRTLAEMARDLIASGRRELAIEVRDNPSRQLFTASLVIEIVPTDSGSTPRQRS